MTRLDEYKRDKDNFSKLNDTLWPVLDGLEPERSKPAHRVNDVTLLLLSIFAFEAICWDCIKDIAAKSQGLRCSRELVPALKAAARRCRAANETVSKIHGLSDIMAIRRLYAHGAGRRSGLSDPSSVPVQLLRDWLFESDECEGCSECCSRCSKTDLQTAWWPTRSLPSKPGAFSKCVGYLDSLAPLIAAMDVRGSP